MLTKKDARFVPIRSLSRVTAEDLNNRGCVNGLLVVSVATDDKVVSKHE
jgi:hypothetical protein